jgi:outer membrane immunogenic protein
MDKERIVKRFVLAAVLASAVTVAQAENFNWAGWYVGGELGYSQLTGNWENTQAFTPGGAAYTGLAAPTSDSMRSNGMIGALDVGYNWLISPKWVVGAEGKIIISNQSNEINNIPGLDPTPDTTPGHGRFSTAKVTQKNGVVLKGRAGYLFTPDSMLYGTAGVVYQQITAEATCPADTHVCNPALGTYGSSNDHNYFGWTLGVGVEHAFTDRWVGRLDYSYTAFESHDFVALQWNPNSYGSNAKLKPSSQSLTMGVNYKF